MTTTATVDETPARPPRRRRARLTGAVFAVGALLLTAACSGDDDAGDASGGVDPSDEGGSGDGGLDVGELDPSVTPEGYEPTPQFLTKVVDDSEATSYRFEMTVDMVISGGGQSVDESLDLMSGEWDGAEYRQRVDIGSNMEEAAAAGEDVPEALTGEDAYVEVVGNDQAMFVQAPFAADAVGALAEMGASSPLYDIYATLGDSWGYVDLTRTGTASGQAAGALGSGSFDPRSIVTTLREAGEVSELGTTEIDGEPVTGVRADTTVGAMLEAQGMDPDAFIQQVGAAVEVPEEHLDAFNEVTLPIEVWLTQDGLVRQVRMVFDTDFMVSLVEAIGEDSSAFEDEVDEFSQTTVVDYSDYGAGDIQVELPDQSQAVDITDDYVAALDSQ
jgi:hypothetical protein